MPRRKKSKDDKIELLSSDFVASNNSSRNGNKRRSKNDSNDNMASSHERALTQSILQDLEAQSSPLWMDLEPPRAWRPNPLYEGEGEEVGLEELQRVANATDDNSRQDRREQIPKATTSSSRSFSICSCLKKRLVDILIVLVGIFFISVATLRFGFPDTFKNLPFTNSGERGDLANDYPTFAPITLSPTYAPTVWPTYSPTIRETYAPTGVPTESPVVSPTVSPFSLSIINGTNVTTSVDTTSTNETTSALSSSTTTTTTATTTAGDILDIITTTTDATTTAARTEITPTEAALTTTATALAVATASPHLCSDTNSGKIFKIAITPTTSTTSLELLRQDENSGEFNVVTTYNDDSLSTIGAAYVKKVCVLPGKYKFVVTESADACYTGFFKGIRIFDDCGDGEYAFEY